MIRPTSCGFGLVPFVFLCLALAACSPEPRPSLLLFVMDTTRRDAVSIYGEVEGTTPRFDAMAREGILYRTAYANASWTLPSHVSMFTGLLPHQHGVGWRRTSAPASLITLAERLRDAGYETAAVSGNPWISPLFETTQGFEFNRLVLSPTAPAEDFTDSIRSWLAERDPDRPFFLFVNVIDSHLPYTVRKTNPYLPPEVTPEAAAAVDQNRRRYVCVSDRYPEDMKVLRGLYLGDVASADRKLAAVMDLLAEEASLPGGLITVVTADHGEQLGDGGMYNHVAGLYESLLRVPLLVHGLPRTSGRVIQAPISLTTIAPSFLTWAGLAVPENMTSGPLPISEPEGRATPVVAEFFDPAHPHTKEVPIATNMRESTSAARKHCTEEAMVWGDMRAAIAPPHKLQWFENQPARHFDLRDGAEHEVAESDEGTYIALETAAVPPAGFHRSQREARADAPEIDTERVVDPRIQAELEALGYLDAPTSSSTPGREAGVPKQSGTAGRGTTDRVPSR